MRNASRFLVPKAPGKDEFEKQLLLMSWVRKQIRGGDPKGLGGMRNALEILELSKQEQRFSTLASRSSKHSPVTSVCVTVPTVHVDECLLEARWTGPNKPPPWPSEQMCPSPSLANVERAAHRATAVAKRSPTAWFLHLRPHTQPSSTKCLHTNNILSIHVMQ
ncbi:MAG: hypothetical protein H8E44_29850 [Planctomycetes bacterium]|nr:hypothetical protein [Planctomycetota bacterium]MBL7043582.1 hypothetical protein [Pirellulaceae bacterium]